VNVTMTNTFPNSQIMFCAFSKFEQILKFPFVTNRLASWINYRRLASKAPKAVRAWRRSTLWQQSVKYVVATKCEL